VSNRRWWREHGRVTRPWMPEPGLWMQFDYGDGPVVDGRKAVLFYAWLAWSRFRVVVALRDTRGDRAGSGAAVLRRRADLRIDR